MMPVFTLYHTSINRVSRLANTLKIISTYKSIALAILYIELSKI